MQYYLFIGGRQDGINIPAAPDLDAIDMPAGVTGKETYIRDTLAKATLAGIRVSFIRRIVLSVQVRVRPTV